MEVGRALAEDAVVAVIRAPEVHDPGGLAEALATSGVRCVEFTFTSPDPLALISVASTSSAIVGAGTVLSAAQAERAIEAGARFVVSPVVRPELQLVCASAGVPLLMGAFTPTEVLAAHEAGADAVKVFPARLGGPGYLRDLLAPLPDLALVPSGGVDKRTAPEYLAAGALAVSTSALVKRDELARGDHQRVGARARQLTARLREAAIDSRQDR